MTLPRSHSKEDAGVGWEPGPRASKANVFCIERYNHIPPPFAQSCPLPPAPTFGFTGNLEELLALKEALLHSENSLDLPAPAPQVRQPCILILDPLLSSSVT